MKTILCGIRNHVGFTILEVMISTLILTLVLGGMLSVSAECVGYINNIRRTTGATQALQQQMEKIRLMNWDSIDAMPSQSSLQEASGRYSLSITKAPYASFEGSTTVVRVAVTATWKDYKGRTVTNSLNTLVSKGGLNNYVF